MLRKVVLWLVLVRALMSSNTERTTPPPQLPGVQFAQTLLSLADTHMAADVFQEMINDSNCTISTPTNATVLVQKLADECTKHFSSIFRNVQEMKSAIERAYADQANASEVDSMTVQECCKLPTNEGEYDSKWRLKLLKDRACARYAHGVVPSAQDLSHTHAGAMWSVAARADPSVLLYYVGTEDGVFLQLPAQTVPSCSAYNARFRDWYVQTHTVTPVDLVIILDSSESMAVNINNVRLAQKAISVILDSMNPTDRVGLIMMNDRADTPPGNDQVGYCYDKKLTFATRDSVEYLKTYMRNVVPASSTNFWKAIARGYALFLNTFTAASERRHRRMILFTDGKGYIPSEPNENVHLWNEHLNNSISSVVFVVGKGIADTVAKLGALIMPSPDLGHDEKDLIITLNDAVDIRTTLRDYYELYNSSENFQTPIVTLPYIDYDISVLVNSVCLPVYNVTQFQGVTCVDIILEEFIQSAISEDLNKAAYAFVIDDTGRTYYHPLLPSPLSRESDSISLHIEMLERDKDVQPIIQDMMNGGKGERTVGVTTIINRGDISTDGVQTRTVMAQLLWRKIEGTRLSICLVYPIESPACTLHDGYKAEHFVYHEFMQDPTNEVCRHLGNLAYPMYSTVKFGPSAFLEPHRYLDLPETANDVSRHRACMEGKLGRQSDCYTKVGVRPGVALTERLEAVWRAVAPSQPYVVWRYVAGADGFIRVYPGTVMDKLYEPSDRPWFRKAVAHPGACVLTAPYNDTQGAAMVVTLARALRVRHKGQGGTGSARAAVGPLYVLAMDVRMTYVADLLQQLDVCSDGTNRCFLVDTSGYLIYHSDFQNCLDEIQSNILDVHIAEKEPAITTYLATRGHLVEKRCVEYVPKREYDTWRILGGDVVQADDPSFELHTVPGTNIFVGIVPKGARQSPTCQSCSAQAAVQKCQTTSRTANDCSCPCYRPAMFNFCNNTFELRADTPPCALQTVTKQYKTYAETSAPSSVGRHHNVSSTPQCFHTVCREQLTSGDCAENMMCVWCDQRVNKSMCIDVGNCSENCISGKGAAGISYTVIIGSTVGGLVALASVTLFCIMFVSHCKNTRQRRYVSDSAAQEFDPVTTITTLGDTPTGGALSGPPRRLFNNNGFQFDSNIALTLTEESSDYDTQNNLVDLHTYNGDDDDGERLSDDGNELNRPLEVIANPHVYEHEMPSRSVSLLDLLVGECDSEDEPPPPPTHPHRPAYNTDSGPLPVNTKL